MSGGVSREEGGGKAGGKVPDRELILVYHLLS